MKKTTISVAVEQEKLRAIQFYMGKNETSLEAELGEFMAKLYKRYVPSQTREYIESMDDPEDRSRPRPNRITKPAGPDAGKEGEYPDSSSGKSVSAKPHPAPSESDGHPEPDGGDLCPAPNRAG